MIECITNKKNRILSAHNSSYLSKYLPIPWSEGGHPTGCLAIEAALLLPAVLREM
jgi:hypothetical protein